MKKVLFIALMIGLCPFVDAQAQSLEARPDPRRHLLPPTLPLSRNPNPVSKENFFPAKTLTTPPCGAAAEAWVARFSRPRGDDDEAFAITFDAGFVYVTGKSDAGSAATGTDYATIKYNSADGQQQWVARYNGPGNGRDQASAIAVDGAGNVYVTGASEGSGSGYDYATIKYNSNGGEQWVARHNGPAPANDYDHAVSLVVDAMGNVYVTGWEGSGDAVTWNYATIKYNLAGTEQWVMRYNGPGDSADTPSALAVDGTGNVYVTGESFGTGTSQDYATIKYNNSDGMQLWVIRYNGAANGSDGATALAVDNTGNVYVTGFSFSASLASTDYATIKYNAAGEQQWVANYNGPGNSWDYANDLALDGAGNVYVTGSSVGLSMLDDYATIKYNLNGVQQWARRYNGTGNDRDEAWAITVDATSNVYVTGESYGTGTSKDYATIKYNSTGVQQWVARYNGPANFLDGARAVAVDGTGNVYVTGSSEGVETYDNTEADYTTIKYSAAGIERWAARYNIEAFESLVDEATAMAVDPDGNVYVTGFSESRLPGTGDDYTVRDYTTVKYDATGVKQWAAYYNGPANDRDEAYAIAVDGLGNVYVTGTSIGAGTNTDFTTIKYNAAGVEQLVIRHNVGPGNTFDEAVGLALDNAGNIYITGFSYTSSAASENFVTVKYNAAGVEQWTEPYNGPGNGHDIPLDLAVDGLGNVHVTGFSVGSTGNRDIATIKYSAAGVRQWLVRYNGPANGDDTGVRLAVDGVGNVYVAGGSDNENFFGDYITIKYNSAGVEQWVSFYDGPDSREDSASEVALDNDGNVYVTGETNGADHRADFATIKYNSSGTTLWVARYDGPAHLDEEGRSRLVVDGTGNVYVSGGSDGSGTSKDYVTLKYNSAGTEEWVARYNGPVSGSDFPHSLAVDGAGNVYVTGSSVASTGTDFLTIKYSQTSALPTDLAVSAGASCVPATNTYTQAVIVTYNNPPASGVLVVNGQSFSSTGSPQTVTLSGLIADGNPVEVTAYFSATPGCARTENALFTAPAACAAPTPPGTNVAVSPRDVTAGTMPVTLTFSEVTGTGFTSLMTGSTGPLPPSGFALGDPPVYYDLATSATPNGNIQVCIDYTGTTYTDESAITLRHFEGGVWVDVTTSRDPVNNIICGTVSSLSPFAIFEPTAKSFVFLTNKLTLSRTKQSTPSGAMHSNGTLTVEKGDPSTYNSNLTAVGKITINKDNTINGNVKSATVIDNQGKINGSKTIGPVNNEPLPRKNFSAGSANKTVPSGGSLTLAPGSYNIVTLNGGGKLKLSSGNYFFNQLKYPGSTAVIEIDLSRGNPVTVNTVSDLQLGKEVEIRLLPHGQSDSKLVTFHTLQSTAVSVGKEAYFLGTLNAPNAKMTLVKNSQLRGTICAKEIVVERDCLFLHHDSPGSLPGPGKLPKASEADESEAVDQSPVTSYQLEQSYPNPFNPSTTIKFAMPEAGKVTLKIYSEIGQLVRTLADGEMSGGRHAILWNGRDQSGAPLASGIYFYQLVAQRPNGEAAFTATKRMTLVK